MQIHVVPPLARIQARIPNDEVWVTDLIELRPDGKPVHSLAALVQLSNGDGPGLTKVVSIIFHYGRAHWAVMVEHSIQAANEFHHGTLSEVVANFERMVGCTLPDIKVVHYGVGLYSAQSKLQNDNPFALIDKATYSVNSTARGLRRFVAEVSNGNTRIRFVQDGVLNEPYEPHLVLAIEDWKSLTRVQDEDLSSLPRLAL